MNKLIEPGKPATQKAASLNKATAILFHIAARSHVLAEQFGVELISTESEPENEPALTLYHIPRPWLTLRPWYDGRDTTSPGELVFDADAYAKTLHQCSDYTTHMRLWILNVWNPSYAKSKGWEFNLFQALNGLDDNNRRAIAWFLRNPIWP